MASNPLQAQATHHAKCNVTLALIAFIVFFIAAFFDSPAFASYQYDDPGYEYGVGWDADTGTGSGAVTTEGVTDLEVTADFGCNADGSTNGVLFMNPQCDASRGAFGVFANVVCRVENIFGAILGLVYCSVSNAILDPLLALFTLYVTLYGALVILGMVPHKFSEAMVRVAKIGAVAAVALNADVAIGVGYTFFISLTQQFISIVFDIFTPDYIEANSALADMIQAGYQASPTNPDESARLYIGNDWMQNLDYTTHRIIGFFMNGGVGFTTVMVMLFLFAPPLFFLIVYLIFAILKAFATAIVGYLKA
ncbi:MAG: hypothetical protein MK052_02195 [Alphaproteobacteria bacterium]|nr:hypothetical protein [Alphaproteobacteria bacterium]